MRILVNATTCVVGGGAQVAANFISRSMRDERHDFVFAVAPEVRSHLGDAPTKGALLVLHPSPGRLLGGYATRKCLRRLVEEWSVDVVFTIFGPAYQRFAVPHVCGYARGWDTHPSQIALALLDQKTRWRYALLRHYHFFRLARRDFYWTETPVSNQGLAAGAHLDPEKIKVIPNCCATIFDSHEPTYPALNQLPYKVLTIASPYVHKRLPFIVAVASEFKALGLESEILFQVTLPPEGDEVSKFWERARRLEVTEMIENLGKVTIEQCPGLYANAHCVFLPTVLETFSVSHLEAMKSMRPIVTSDVDCLREVCGDAARYFEPNSASAAAKAIRHVLYDPDSSRSLIDAGVRRLASLPSPEEKYLAHIGWLEEVVRLSQVRQKRGSGL